MLIFGMIVVLLSLINLFLSRINDLPYELLLFALLRLLLVALVRAYSLCHLVQLLQQLTFIAS